MASTLEELDVDVPIKAVDQGGSTEDGEMHRLEEEEGEGGEEKEEYAKTVERLRSLVFSESHNIDEVRRLIVVRLPDSACETEDAISPIRANLWSVMLLGLRPEDLSRCGVCCRVSSKRGINHSFLAAWIYPVQVGISRPLLASVPLRSSCLFVSFHVLVRCGERTQNKTHFSFPKPLSAPTVARKPAGLSTTPPPPLLSPCASSPTQQSFSLLDMTTDTERSQGTTSVLKIFEHL